MDKILEILKKEGLTSLEFDLTLTLTDFER